MKKPYLLLPLITLMACDTTPMTTEECIDYIYANARVSEQVILSDLDDFGQPQTPQQVTLMVFEIKLNNGGWMRLKQETALKLSKNWNFSDMKYYDRFGGEIQEHQRDACEVVERMKEFQKRMN